MHSAIAAAGVLASIALQAPTLESVAGRKGGVQDAYPKWTQLEQSRGLTVSVEDLTGSNIVGTLPSDLYFYSRAGVAMTLPRCVFFAGVVAVLSSACSGGSPTAPGAATAQTSITSTSCTTTIPTDQLARTINDKGGRFSITVSTGASCVWSATSTEDFVTIAAGASGTGSGHVEVQISPNAGGERSGQIRIGSVTVSVTQEAAPESDGSGPSPTPPNPNPNPNPDPAPNPNPNPAPPSPTPTPPTPPPPGPCVLSVSPLTVQVPALGGTVSVSVRATQGSNCTWTALPVSLFLAMNGEPSRTGDGTVTFIVSSNTGPARTGTATVAGQTITFTQEAVAPTTCVFNVSPTRVTLPVAGGTATFMVRVTQGTACAWTTTIAGTGITITSGASGTGDGAVVVAVAPNPGVERTNGIIIAGQLVTIVQPELPGACTYAASPPSFNISSASQTVAFDLTITRGTPESCQWSAGVADPSLIRIVSMTPAGNTTRVVIWVSENTGRVDRVLSVVAAGIAVTVGQAGSIPPGPCMYAVSPTTVNAPAAASSVSLSVTLLQGSAFSCSWSSVPNAPFLSLTSITPVPEAAGANVVLAIAANAGAARTGTLTIAGHVVTVNQQPAAGVR